MRVWVCTPVPGLYNGPCTPETGGKPITLHKWCGWVGEDEEEDEKGCDQ